ncbi:aldehyde dehydrogenase family protein [Nonomuraea sediminis]|uniref:aldehyde dehydrogenase family protein n=1 Tax=Nonomuraea sediminis TaxID=2835864 RepID=UPI001BDC171B|nr:aldehyde dehydrogenase family protein [Nonomuraea sediminis]
MLDRARWAARAYATYDKPAVDRVVAAVARVAADNAARYAERAVKETGLGVAEHKVVKNLACSTGLVEIYAGQDFVSPSIDPARKIVSVPRPAGVVLALTPSTNPVATVYFKVLLALMTRNAVVVSPHPLAKECCADAARVLGEAAVAAGAPDGIVQVVEEPTIPLIESLMADPRTDLIVATGGPAVVHASYRSGNPAIGVGPGNVPVLVDRTADLPAAARRIVESKSFDNSILCTNESVLIVEDAAYDTLLSALSREGAHLVADGLDRLRAAVGDRENIGQSAVRVAERAGFRVPAGTKVLLAPFDLAVPEEPLAREKLMPVLGLLRVPSAEGGIRAAQAVLRISGAGHSAAIHSTDAATIMKYGAAVPVLRVSVNAGNSLGSAGITTGLAPSMTIGTGFVGGSSVGENLNPAHLINWTRLASGTDTTFPDFSGLDPWHAPTGAVPPYPHASNAASDPRPPARPAAGDGDQALRAEIRRLILEELAAMRGA